MGKPRWRKAPGRAGVRMRPFRMVLPDPPMVPSVALRRIEQAETLEEVRAIVHQFIPDRSEDAAG